jgi:hypothetical protein
VKRSRSFLQLASSDYRVNQQFFSMFYRTALDLFSRVKDKGAYRSPEAIHRADTETAIRRPCASVHKRTLLSQDVRVGRALTGPANCGSTRLL